MKYTVIIPAIRSTVLSTAVNSIRRQTWMDWELIVVGQGQDTSIRAVTESIGADDRRVHYLHLDEYGASRARNEGVRAADTEFIAFIDDDCEADEKWLETMSDYFNHYPDVGMVSGAVIRPPKPHPGLGSCPALSPSEALYDPSATPQQPPVGWDWISCNIGFRRSALELVGPFDEYLGPGSQFPIAEDTDLKLRMESLGIKMFSTPRVVVHHTHGYRMGIRTMLRNSRNYAYGNGALAGKRTLLGDERGEIWLNMTRREAASSVWRRPYRFPVDLRRLRYFTAAYHHCVNNFRVDSDVLQPI